MRSNTFSSLPNNKCLTHLSHPSIYYETNRIISEEVLYLEELIQLRLIDNILEVFLMRVYHSSSELNSISHPPIFASAISFDSFRPKPVLARIILIHPIFIFDLIYSSNVLPVHPSTQSE